MSRSKQKGTFAESAVLAFIARWFPGHDVPGIPASLREYALRNPLAASILYPPILSIEEYEGHSDRATEHIDALSELYDPVYSEAVEAGRWSGEGLPFRRVPSMGLNDAGDIDGPFTAIEVKNYTNPPLSTLLANAEWKGKNSRKPYWFLVYKAAGRGLKSVGQWHVLTTVEELFTGFGAAPLDQSYACTPEALDRWVPEAVTSGLILPGSITSPAPGRSTPEHPWSPRFVFADIRSSVPERREKLYKEHATDVNPIDRAVPIVVTPRRGENGSGLLPARKWYAYTKLEPAARLLETLGVLPAEEGIYPSLPSSQVRQPVTIG